MNLSNYYWYFESAVPHKICDDIVRYGQLLKDRESKYEVEKGKDNETKGMMPNEDDKTAGSPIHTGPGRE